MATQATKNPFSFYADLEGNPLQNGFIYYGTVGNNPETNPIAIYWDIALSQPAPQPLRTTNGQIIRNGIPANVFTASDYSITVRDKASNLIYSVASAANAGLATGYASAGNNSDITQLSGLTTPISPSQGGTPYFIGSDATGGANAIVSSLVVPASGFTLTPGYKVTVLITTANTGAATLNFGSTGAISIRAATNTGLQPLNGGEMQVGMRAEFELVSSTVWQLCNPYSASQKTTTNAITAAYTVATSDVGVTIVAAGAAYYTITFNAAAGYPIGNYLLVNNDTRAKKIVLTGGITYKLWPGQSDIISNVMGSWRSLNGPQRWRLTGTTIIYVNQASGVVDTDGLAVGAGAFSTFKDAYDQACNSFDTQSFFVAFYFANAVYTASSPTTEIEFDRQLMGNGQMIIDCQGGTIFGTGATTRCINYSGHAGHITVRNVTFTVTSGECVSISYPGEINLSTNVIFGPCGGSHLQASGTGAIIYVNDNYTVSGGCNNHYECVQGAYLVVYSPVITISANITVGHFAYSDRNGVLQMKGNAYSLGAFTVTGIRYFAATGGNITGTAANINFFPGTIAGASVTGYYT